MNAIAQLHTAVLPLRGCAGTVRDSAQCYAAMLPLRCYAGTVAGTVRDSTQSYAGIVLPCCQMATSTVKLQVVAEGFQIAAVSVGLAALQAVIVRHHVVLNL